VEAGIDQIAAHLFILYFGMMSMITPPVALAAFAAATISKTPPLATGLAAMRIGWAAFILPFLFVASPALLMQGGWDDIARDFALSAVGVGAVTAGIVGYWGRRLGLAARAGLTILGFLALPLGFLDMGAPPHAAGALAAAALMAALMFFKTPAAGRN
jgi:TRAP-type uncharacterized transport system fused permease subunit